MGKRAKSLHQQIELLRRRGMTIANEEKAKETILEIGWYRLSLYWFPFERRYPNAMSEKHEFIEGVCFEDALMLYAFDFYMRNMLMRKLERVETAFRTYMIYTVSNAYPDSPHWFADERVVNERQARNFERAVYIPLRRVSEDIILHHRRFPRDRFAPAWKTLEFVTFGTMCNLYSSLQSRQIRADISRHFGVNEPETLENYLEALRGMRNICAHGNLLYSYKTPSPIAHRPAGTPRGARNLAAALEVLQYLLERITPREAGVLRQEIKELLQKFDTSPRIHRILKEISGFHLRPLG